MIQNARIYNGEKTVSSISDTRKTGWLHQKNEIRTFSNIIYRNKLKVREERPKCKTRYYKTLRGKHKQNTRWHKWQKYFLDPSPRVMKIKVKINKWGPIKLKSFATVKQTIQWKNEKTTYDLEGNTCKWCNQQRIVFQNISIQKLILLNI